MRISDTSNSSLARSVRHEGSDLNWTFLVMSKTLLNCRLDMKCVITHTVSGALSVCCGMMGRTKRMPVMCPDAAHLCFFLFSSLSLSILRSMSCPCQSAQEIWGASFTILFITSLPHCVCFCISCSVSLSLFLSLMPSLSVETSRPQTSFHTFWLTSLCFSVRDTLWGSAVWVTHYGWILSEVLHGCHLLKSTCNHIHKPFYFLTVMKFRMKQDIQLEKIVWLKDVT